MKVIFKLASQLLCKHEWIRKTGEPGKLHLECMKCLKTTPGFDLSDLSKKKAA